MARGTRRTSEDVTFSGGTKADGLTSKRMRPSQRHCTSTNGTRRKQDQKEREEHESLLEVYLRAINGARVSKAA